MNKRIRKKKAKQQLIRAISGLVEAAEEMQREQTQDNTGRYFLYQVYRSCPGTAVRHYACLHTTF